MTQVAFQENLTCVHCATCGVQFGITTSFYERRLKDHKDFWCPSGHTNFYSSPNTEEQLRRQLSQAQVDLAAAKRRAEMEAASRRAVQAQATRAKNKLARVTNRVNHGVCPHCDRTVKQLAAHIATKHATVLGK